ncbi:hypothetical protein PspLS_06585 [Pyricularia sp. CBS 133598]|nr:hypothetical protein PspLS_06585 [Pyricularia sp. CBS 133598]
MSLLCKRKGRRLLPQLLEMQRDDVDITAPIYVAFKFYFCDAHFGKRCVRVDVKPSDQDLCLGAIRRTGIPRFLLSQLEVQGIANEKDEFIQLHPVLSFILLSLPVQLSQGSSYPTVFRWHCGRNHRTRVLFAYLDFTMPSRCYTTEQLLALRGSRVSGKIQAIVRTQPDLSQIITMPKERSVNTATVPATNTLRRTNKDDSSTESDELLYKGQRDRQFPQADGSWKLRERDEPDSTATSEPVQAQPAGVPVGPSTQHSEGFRRFYKSVASPTHVRVTAGGRIVPNTRGPPSPTIKRPKGKSTQEPSVIDGSPAQSHVKPALGEADAPPGSKPPNPAQMPMFPPILANLPPGSFASSTPGPMQFVPMPMPMVGINLPFSSFQMPPVPPVKGGPYQPGVQLPAAAAAADGSKDKNPSSNVNGRQTDAKDLKISPIEQLDLTKPYLFNGQMFFPVPGGALTQPIAMPFMSGGAMAPGFGPITSGMVPHGIPVSPAFPGMSFAGAPSMMHGMAPGTAPPAHQQHQPSQQQPHATSSSSFQPPAAPPISSIRPSDISKKQIETLRGTLKYHEDQLHFNKHQVDEKEMDKTIKMLRAEIKRFDDLCQKQLVFEAEHYPSREQSTDSTDTTAPVDFGSLTEHPSSVTTCLPDQQRVTAALENARRTGALRKKDSTRARSALNSSSSNKASSLFDFDDEKEHLRINEMQMRACLPSGAALAPPFEPRSSSCSEQARPNSAEPLPPNGLTKEARQRLLLAGSKAWDKFEGLISTPVDPKGKMSRGKTPTQRLGAEASGSSTQEKTRYELLYLIGTLPPGVDARTANATDYRYPRELTDDELRARYLYLGKAPEEVRRGLPKYDGRNFYKSSIVEESQETTPVAAPSGASRRGASVSADSARSYNKPNPSRDPFQPSTPDEKAHQAQLQDSPISARIASLSKAFMNKPSDMTESDSRAVQSSSSNDKSNEAPEKRSLDRSGCAFLHKFELFQALCAVLTFHIWLFSVRLLQSMLNRGGNQSNEALPGAVTSTHAQGYVPPYSYSTFSLAPPNMGQAVQQHNGSPPSSTPPNDSDKNESLINAAIERHAGENRPPVGHASLEEQFRRIVSAENRQRAAGSLPINGRMPADW